MPSPLQKAAQGFLALFNLKTLGRMPTRFGDEVVPTFDTADAYASDLMSIQEQTLLAQNTPATISMAVPAGRVWRLRSVSASLAATDATTQYSSQILTVSIGVAIAAANFNHRLAATSLLVPTGSVIGAASVLRCASGCFRPLWLPPGSVVRATFEGATSAGTFACIASAIVEQLDT